MIKIHLRKLLFDRQMSQADLIRLTKIRDGTIGAYYHGYIKRMNVEDIDKICEALECKVEDLIEFTSNKK